MLWQRAKTVGIVFHIAKLRTKFETNKYSTRKVANFVIFLLLLRGWAFGSSRKNFLLSDEKRFCSLMKKKGRGFVFASAKNGNECDPNILLFVLVFSIYLFSNTDRCFCLFVRLFVCLRAREEAYVKCSFASLYNTFFDTQKVQFLQHNLHTVFAHNFCTILHTFLIQFWLHFWCKLEYILMQFGELFWYFFEYQFAVEIHRYILQKVAIILLKTTRCLQ